MVSLARKGDLVISCGSLNPPVVQVTKSGPPVRCYKLVIYPVKLVQCIFYKPKCYCSYELSVLVINPSDCNYEL